MTLLTNPKLREAVELWLGLWASIDKTGSEGGDVEMLEAAEQAILDALTAPRDFDKAVEAAVDFWYTEPKFPNDHLLVEAMLRAALPHLTGESELVKLVREYQEARKMKGVGGDERRGAACRALAAYDLSQWGSE